MKTKKIIEVRLKNLVLRRIRANFRVVIRLTVEQEVNRLYDMARKYQRMCRDTVNPDEIGRLKREARKFMKLGGRLKNLLSKSIIHCTSSGGCISYLRAKELGLDTPANLDMVWIPSFNGWFCTRCGKHLISEDKLLRRERHPDYMRQLKHLGLL